jgi:hypothetical protein
LQIRHIISGLDVEIPARLPLGKLFLLSRSALCELGVTLICRYHVNTGITGIALWLRLTFYCVIRVKPKQCWSTNQSTHILRVIDQVDDQAIYFARRMPEPSSHLSARIGISLAQD